jgi:hypothetical protein
MANEEQLARLKHWVGDRADWRGVEAWNQWRAAHRDIRPDLSGADLSGLGRVCKLGSDHDTDRDEPRRFHPYARGAAPTTASSPTTEDRPTGC